MSEKKNQKNGEGRRRRRRIESESEFDPVLSLLLSKSLNNLEIHFLRPYFSKQSIYTLAFITSNQFPLAFSFVVRRKSRKEEDTNNYSCIFFNSYTHVKVTYIQID